MPGQTFTHSAIAKAEVNKVWKGLQRPETWEAIGGVNRVFDPRFDEEGGLAGFSFETLAAGKSYVGKATRRERVTNRVMSWDVSTSEIRGVTTVELSETDGATMVRVTLDVESVGMLSTMFFPVIAAGIGSGLPEAVERFTDTLAESEAV